MVSPLLSWQDKVHAGKNRAEEELRVLQIDPRATGGEGAPNKALFEHTVKLFLQQGHTS